MSEQLQKSLAEILALLTESAKTVGSAAQQEIPLLVQEYLRWGFWSSVILFVAWSLVFGFVLFAGRYGWKRTKGINDFDRPVVRILIGAGVAIGAVVAFVGAIDAAMVAIQVVIAPRVYLLEHVLKAVK